MTAVSRRLREVLRAEAKHYAADVVGAPLYPHLAAHRVRGGRRSPPQRSPSPGRGPRWRTRHLPLEETIETPFLPALGTRTPDGVRARRASTTASRSTATARRPTSSCRRPGRASAATSPPPPTLSTAQMAWRSTHSRPIALRVLGAAQQLELPAPAWAWLAERDHIAGVPRAQLRFVRTRGADGRWWERSAQARIGHNPDPCPPAVAAGRPGRLGERPDKARLAVIVSPDPSNQPAASSGCACCSAMCSHVGVGGGDRRTGLRAHTLAVSPGVDYPLLSRPATAATREQRDLDLIVTNGFLGSAARAGYLASTSTTARWSATPTPSAAACRHANACGAQWARA